MNIALHPPLVEVDESFLSVSEVPPAKIAVGECIRLWGGPASMTLLDTSCHHFSLPHVRGVIGYRLEAGCAIVFGDPVCDPKDKWQLALAFQEYCQKNQLHFIYIAASVGFANWAMNHICGTLLEIGHELVIDPRKNPKIGSVGRVLRRKTNHATAEGVTVHEYQASDVHLKPLIERVGKEWLHSRKGPQLYLADVNFCAHENGRRIFYAKHGEKIVGVLLLNQMEVHKRWLLHLLMMTPEAPNGTPELLVIAVIEKLREEGCCYLSLGVAQAAELGKIQGLNGLSIWIARRLFKIAQRLFSLDGRRIFWQKFQPHDEPAFILWDRKGIGFKHIRGLKRALNISL